MMLVAASLGAICFAGYSAQEPELEIVLSRASAYVESYEQALGMMIAREEYRQEDVFAHGRMWIDPVDGRIVRTDIRTYDEANELHSEIRVRYQPDDELGIWVPRDMRERYKVGRERVEGDARYSNFQQFEVTVDTSIGK